MGKTIRKNTIRRLLQKEGWISKKTKKRSRNEKERKELAKDFADSLSDVIQRDPDFKKRVFEKALLDPEFEKMIIKKRREKGTITKKQRIILEKLMNTEIDAAVEKLGKKG